MRDYYTDNGNLFARIFSNRDLPDFVRNSVESEKTAAIHDSGFADETNRLLPIHTAADTYISAAYFAKQAVDAQVVDRDVAVKIYKAASLYGIRKEVDEVMAYAGSLREKVAELEAPKMAEFEFESGVTGIAKIRGCGPDAVQKAAEFVLSNRQHMPVANLMNASEVLVKAAADNATQIDPMFEQFSGKLASDRSVIEAQKAIRLNAIDPLQKTAAAEELSAANGAVKLADFDAKYDLVERYGRAIAHPCEVFHSALPEPKQASFAKKVQGNLSTLGTKGAAYQAIEVALGAERAGELLKAGAPLLDEEVSAVAPYLAGQI